MFHIKKWTCKQIRFPQWKWACVSLRGIWCNISSWCWTRVAGCTVGMYRVLSAWIADYWPTSVAYQRGLLIHNTKMTQGLSWYRHDISLRFQETQVIRIFVSWRSKKISISKVSTVTISCKTHFRNCVAEWFLLSTLGLEPMTLRFNALQKHHPTRNHYMCNDSPLLHKHTQRRYQWRH